jgi:hypothetical protein
MRIPPGDVASDDTPRDVRAARRYNPGMKNPLNSFGRVLALLLGLAAAGFGWMASSLSPDIELGSIGPEVTLTTLSGEPLAVSSLRGQVVLLDFWAST